MHTLHIQEAQLSQRGRVMLRAVEYFAKSLTINQRHCRPKWYHWIDRIQVPVVTTALFCIISEIKRDVGRKSIFFPTHLRSTPQLGGPCRNIAITFGVEKLERWIYHTMNTVWIYVYWFRTWRTDRRTDSQRPTAYVALMLVSRGNERKQYYRQTEMLQQNYLPLASVYE